MRPGKPKQKLGIIKIQSFGTTEARVNQTQGQHPAWEKIFAKDAVAKGLVSNTGQELKLNTQNPKTPVKELGEDRNKHVSKEHTQISNRQKKKCSTPLGIREQQTKTTMTYHPPLLRMPNMNNPGHTRCWGGLREKSTYAPGRNADQCSLTGKQCGHFINTKMELPDHSAIALLGD